MKPFITLKTEKIISTKKAYFLWYTLLFMVITPIVFMAFLQQGKGFVWISNGGGKDGYQQHYMAFAYLGQWLREIARSLFSEGGLQIPLWDFSIGYGADIVTTFNFYALGDPLNIVSVFVPTKYAEYAYTAVALLRVYLSGIAFSLFCFKMNKGKTATLAGAITYAFSGYAVYNCARHVFFMNPMIYLPLILLGAEKIFRKEKPLLFVFMVFITALSNFYFLYMIVIGVVMYVLIRYFTMEREKSVKDFFATIGKFAGGGLLGIGMSAVVVLPVLNVFFSSGRHSVTGGVKTLLYESADYYIKLITGFFGGASAGHYSCLAFAAPLFVALIVMFTSRKKYTALKIGTVVMFAMLSLAVVGRMMNGFSYASNRWSFMVAGLMAYIFTSVWEDLFVLSKKKVVALVSAGVLYTILLLIFNEHTHTSAIISLIIIYICIALVILVFKASAAEKCKRLVSFALIILTVISVCSNGYLKFVSGKAPYIGEFLKHKEAYKGIQNSYDKEAAKLIDEKHFARNEHTAGASVLNASVLTESTGTQHYWSLENGVVSGWLFDSEKNVMLPQMYYGVDSRAYLQSLASVKYYMSPKKHLSAYGMKKHSKFESNGKKVRIFENKNALPLGYTYSSCIDFQEYEKMDAVEKQRAVLQGVVVENAHSTAMEKFRKINPVYTHQEIEAQIKPNKNVVVMKDGSYVVNKDNAKLTLTFDGLDESETYLHIQGMFAEYRTKYELYMDDCDEVFSKDEFNSLPSEKQEKIKNKNTNERDTAKDNSKIKVQVESDNCINKLQYYNIDFKYATGQENFLVNMGYNKKGLKKLTVKFGSAGVYKFDKMSVVCQPMEDLPEMTKALKEDVLENEKISVNSVEGNISLSQDKILCLSIPFSKGWTAYVDGEKVDLFKANGAFMAIPLTAGEHTVQLRYFTPLMKVGAGVSLVSFGIFIGMAIACVLIKRKQRKTK